MTKTKKTWLITAIVIIAAAVILLALYFSKSRAGNDNTKKSESAQQTDVESYLEEEEAIMATMMQKMHVVPTTGSASLHFLKGMLPHHESAVEMAESYLKYGGKNTELKKLAEDIIKTQTKEIKDMEAMIERLEKDGQSKEELEDGYLNEYNKMMMSHHSGTHSQTPPADVEKAFSEGMIVHHQMAVEMSEAVLKYTEDEAVKKLAGNIISAQEKEIKQMQKFV